MTAAPKPSRVPRPAPPLRRRTSPLNLQPRADRPHRDALKLAGDWGVSLLVHVVVISGAILYATQSARRVGTPGAFGTTVVAIALPEPRYASPPPALGVPLRDYQTVTVPVAVPTAIPPVDLQEHFDPRDFAAAEAEGETATGVTPVPDLAYDPNLVDDPPILLSSPPLLPELLHEAGPTSRVVVQAVIDTAGHAEPASVRVIRSADTAFDHHAQQWMLKALWRPARVAGHPVRLWINRAIDYTITMSR